MPDDGSTRVPHLRLVVNNGPVTRRPRGETIGSTSN